MQFKRLHVFTLIARSFVQSFCARAFQSFLTPTFQSVWQRLSPYFQLIRFDKPIGTVLLFWPCVWGIIYCHKCFHTDLALCFQWGAVILLGAFCARSLGCIVNDLTDRTIDAQVARTENRPLASGVLRPIHGYVTIAVLTIPLLVIWTFLPNVAQLYSVIGALLLVVYPWMKRITYYPQFVLGLAFNIGVLVAYATVRPVHDNIQTFTTQLLLEPSIWLLYAFGVFWTVAYDTIYAFQDIADDVRVGVYSTAVRWQKYPKAFIATCYIAGAFCLLGVTTIQWFDVLVYAAFSGFVLLKWQPKNPQSCARMFRAHGAMGGCV